MRHPPSGRSSPSLLELTSLGGLSAVLVGLGTGGGYWIASATGAGALVIFAGLVVGITAAVGVAYFRIKRYF